MEKCYICGLYPKLHKKTDIYVDGHIYYLQCSRHKKNKTIASRTIRSLRKQWNFLQKQERKGYVKFCKVSVYNSRQP